MGINKLFSNTMFKAAAILTSMDYEFMRFVTEHGKSYGTVAEFNFRGEQFAKRHEEIVAFNADSNNTHVVGHNEFSDMTYAEMKSNAATVDWRSKGAVTPVKNQGQ